MTPREQQIKEMQNELAMSTLTKSRRRDLKGMLEHARLLAKIEARLPPPVKTIPTEDQP